MIQLLTRWGKNINKEEVLKENLKRSVLEKASGFDVMGITFSVVREENFVRVDCSCDCLVDLAVL